MEKIILLLFALLLSGSTLKNTATRPNRDYALFFAVNDYQPGSGFDDLSKPIENAEAVAKELRDRYGFSTEVVKNPTLDQISAKLEEYKAWFAKNPQGKYPSSGQLLIYFTGHGISQDNNGYFVPSNGDIKKLYSTAFAYEIWRPIINKIDCRHILVAIDACYSVTFDPDWYNKKMDPSTFKRPGELSEGDKLLLANETDKCRIVFTSDGEEDKVPERSNFARKFIEGLQAGPRQDGILTSEGLAAYLRFAAPKPRLTEFGDDQKGSFLFVQVPAASAAEDDTKKSAAAADLEKDLAAWRTAKTANTIAAYRKYLNDFPGGEFGEQAQAAIRAIEQDLAIRRDELAWEVAVEKNTVEAYKKYQVDFPNGRHYTEAAGKIKALQINATSIPLGSAPQTGFEAPELVGMTPEKSTFSLKQLRGKVVLVDFWASWCFPCRRENPNVVANYIKYKDKDFDILGVSLDTVSMAWRNAIRQDGLSWHHISDLQGWKSAHAALYSVTSIPKTFLLDRDGKIIALNLRGEKLGQKLEEIFGE